jgi:hypothetical protein
MRPFAAFLVRPRFSIGNQGPLRVRPILLPAVSDLSGNVQIATKASVVFSCAVIALRRFGAPRQWIYL